MSARLRLAVLAILCSTPLRAGDQGMWPYSSIPYDRILKKYGVALDPKLVEDIRLATVRLSGPELGASGVFVSPEGLIATNLHVASAGCLQELFLPAQGLRRDGYLAASREEEVRCPGLAAKVLVSLENI